MRVIIGAPPAVTAGASAAELEVMREAAARGRPRGAQGAAHVVTTPASPGWSVHLGFAIDRDLSGP
jgi:hypothetical protein